MDKLEAFPVTLWRKAIGYWRRLWVRVLLMGALALAVIGLTQLVEPLIPADLAGSISGQGADRLLDLIANAMLAATIFSLTVMVSVFRSSASQWTPRIHRLIMEDPTTQNTLATFIGAYVYALTAIMLRELGVYGEQAFVLFWTTVAVLVLLVLSLIRWTLHLQTFGSLIASTRQVEGIARMQFEARLARPCLGAHPLADESEIPDAATQVRADETGYIQTIYQEALNAEAKNRGFDVYLVRTAGTFVIEGEVMAWIHDKEDAGETRDDGKDFEEVLRAHIMQGDARTYHQDPRFGLMVLGEIGSKALSPGINDPGTAIDVITRLTRLLMSYHDEGTASETPAFDRLWVPPLSPAEMIENGFGALARDGSAVIEVQLHLQKAFAALMNHPDPKMDDAAFDAAVTEYQRAMEGLDFIPDRDRLRTATDPRVVAELEGARDAPRSVMG